MNMNFIPEVINNFNVYKSGNRLIGVTSEMSLAEISAITETISGAGLLGEYETVIMGHFSSMSQEVPFRMLEEDVFSLANPMEVQELTLRATEQVSEKGTANLETKGMRIVIRGRAKAFKPGTIKMGGQMGASVTLELLYMMIEINGEKKFELDKLNEVFIVDGVDIMAQIKQYC